MKKIVVTCKKCKKKMKILDKPAKYRCPHCKEIYKLSKINQIIEKTKRVLKDAKKTVVEIFKIIKNKFETIKFQYKQVKKMRKK